MATYTYRNQNMTYADMIQAVGDTAEMTFAALYELARHDPEVGFLTRLPAGCSDVELDTAEARIGRPLHPLHRVLLKQANGGTLPYCSSLAWLAAAVSRELTWVPLGAPEGQDLSDPVVAAQPGLAPVEPLLLGAPVLDLYPGFIRDRLIVDGLDGAIFITVAQGFSDSGEDYLGYASMDDTIEYFSKADGRGPSDADFEAFIMRQTVYAFVSTDEFVERVRAAIAAMHG